VASGRNRGPLREDVLERGVEPDRDRACEDGCLAEGRHLDAGRVREPVLEQPSDRVEQQVAVRADAAAEDDELDVDDRRDRASTPTSRSG
jgi:hypothetical protein